MAKRRQTPEVILLGFAGCPNLAAARAALVDALQASGMSGEAFGEYDTGTEGCPEALRCWPSPTILVNGVDVEGAAPDSANACRIYDGGTGAPSIENITAAIEKAEIKA